MDYPQTAMHMLQSLHLYRNRIPYPLIHHLKYYRCRNSVAAAISAITATIEGGEGYADVIIIMVVVLINAILGVVQESKAEAAIEALQQMSAATSKVMRNGHIAIVKSEDLVCVPYTTVLAANETGRAILSRIRKTSDIPIITKPADAIRLGDDIARAFSLSARADSTWELLLTSPASGERMMREHPRMM